MSENQTPTNPADDVVAVVEDLVERQRQILGALVATTHPLKNDVQAVLLGLRGVVTKLRNGAAEADATTPTNPDLRDQIQRVLRERCEVEDRQYTDGTGWVLVRDDNVAHVVANYFAPVLEGLCRTATEEQKRGDALYEERDKYIRLLMDEQEKVAALSSLLRGMARWATKLRRGMRGHEARIAHLVSRPSVSDQTPATPDEPHRLADALELIEEMHGYVPAYFADKWQINERIAALRSTAPSSVQGDTTPGEGDQS